MHRTLGNALDDPPGSFPDDSPDDWADTVSALMVALAAARRWHAQTGTCPEVAEALVVAQAAAKKALRLTAEWHAQTEMLAHPDRA